MALIGRASAGLVVAVVVTALLLLAGPAHAHGGGAVFEVLEAEESAPGEVSVRMRISHEADGDAAEGAIVEIAATGPGGARVDAASVDRADEPGIYTSTLELDEPGAWSLEVTSSFPPGTTEIPVEVGGAEPGSDTTNLVVAAVFGVVGGSLGLWVSKRRSARRRTP